MAEIKTRIILRNDTAEAWADSDVELKTGEAAVEIKDGKAKVKIATADGQTFADAAYIGSEDEKMFQRLTEVCKAHGIEVIKPLIVTSGVNQ